MKVILSLVMLVLSAMAAHAITTSKDLTITVTSAATATISSIALSNTNTTTGLSTGTAIGTVSVALAPVTPTFSYSGTNLHLSATGTDSGGICNGTNGAGNGSFQITGGDTLATNGTPSAGSYLICLAAAESGVPAAGQAFTIKVGNLINATTFCAGHGGGNGSSGSPWTDACINAAVAAAADGDTVFLASGNWGLFTNGSAVVITKAINLVGAGSGNTFDAFGRPNNASGAAITATTGNGITRVFTTGPYTGCSLTFAPTCTSNVSGPGGTIQFTNCSNMSMQHIAFDGSVGYAGGDRFATGSVIACTGVLVNDVRTLSWGHNGATFIGAGETQFNISDVSQNVTVQSSTFNVPAIIDGMGNYPGTQAFQLTDAINSTLNNNYFYQIAFSPIAMNSTLYTGNQTFVGKDAFGDGEAFYNQVMGLAGCPIGPHVDTSIQSCREDHTATNGSVHFTATNNLFLGNNSFGTFDWSLGPWVNDPGTAGGVQDVNYSGNWIVARLGSFAACNQNFWDPVTQMYSGFSACKPTDDNTHGNPGHGMQINGSVNSDCTESDTTLNNYGYNIVNNSIVGTYAAALDASGTGTITNCWITNDPLTGQVPHTNTVVNFRAHQNYLSSPKNDYHTSSVTHNPTVVSNFCTGGGGTFTQTDATQCASSGFTQSPTASFTLNPLAGGSLVPFNVTNFTAQYGAVQWLASTSPTTPASNDARWSYVPPFSLSATHGNTVYLWVMDSANHISVPASVVVP